MKSYDKPPFVRGKDPNGFPRRPLVLEAILEEHSVQVRLISAFAIEIAWFSENFLRRVRIEAIFRSLFFQRWKKI
jgi:hypothetical protein